MTLPPWVEVAIAAEHDRKAFDCGDDKLDGYLQRYARQNHVSGGAKCFVAIDPTEPRQVLGYYTLSPASLAHDSAPDLIRARLARYEVPVFRLGRLAVDRRVQGRGLGGRLLLSAGERALRVADEVGGVALLIDAKNEDVARWYAGFGAVAAPESPLTLFLPLSTIRGLLDR